MTSQPHSGFPFVAGPMITEADLFVGRKKELEQMARWMSSRTPTSVNIAGGERIGKSSLLYRFSQMWQEDVQNARYMVIYLDLASAGCEHKDGFYKAVAENLLKYPFVQGQQALNQLLQATSFNGQTFSEAIWECQRQGLLPVLCLDEFEALFYDPNEFNFAFYSNLQTLMKRNALMLVVASQKSLHVYCQENKLPPKFFNSGRRLLLGKFTQPEAEELVQLPVNKGSNTDPILTAQEQEDVLKWGGRHPYLLQLAATLIYEARQRHRGGMAWAKAEFEKQVRNLLWSRLTNPQRWWPPLRWVFWDLPVRLGSMAKFLGRAVDDVTNWIIGVVFVILVILVFAGVLHWNQVWDFVRDKLGIK